MIVLNSKIVVVPSQQLSEIQLSGTEGKQGRVIQDLTSRKRRSRGCIVRFAKSYLGEKEWFIPLESIGYDE